MTAPSPFVRRPANLAEAGQARPATDQRRSHGAQPRRCSRFVSAVCIGTCCSASGAQPFENRGPRHASRSQHPNSAVCSNPAHPDPGWCDGHDDPAAPAGRGRLSRHALQADHHERPQGQQRPAGTDPPRRGRRHPPRLPRSRRRHHRDLHLQRHPRVAGRVRAGGSWPTRLNVEARSWFASCATNSPKRTRPSRASAPACSGRPRAPCRSRRT
jgi:hypothetical protein